MQAKGEDDKNIKKMVKIYHIFQKFTKEGINVI